MGILDSLRSSGVSAAVDPGNDRFYGNEGAVMSTAGRVVSPDISMQFSAVYHCVSLLAKVIASLEIHVMQEDADGNSVAVPRHPLRKLLQQRPNKWQTTWDFRCMMMMHYLLRGNAYAEIVPGPMGFADQLEPIHPDRMVVELLQDGTLRYRYTDRFGKQKVKLQEEIFHLRSHIAPGLVGISPIAYARQTIGLALAAEEFGSRTFSNGARPSGVVQVKKEMSNAAFDRFKSEWRNIYNGLAGAGATPILEDGAEFKPISMNSDDAQFLASREFQIEEVCRWFDVPPALLHHMTKQTANGTGVESTVLSFRKLNLNSHLICWEQAISRDLILVPDVFSVRFDVESFIRGDSQAQADFFSRLTLNGILTRNEARHELGYNPLPGLSEPLTPTNTTTSDSLPKNGSGSPKKGTGAGASKLGATL